MSNEPSELPHPERDAELGHATDVGPDPAIGAGVTLLGIFLMGLGGSIDRHYFFNVGVLVAVLGAVMFVACVALTAFYQRRAKT